METHFLLTSPAISPTQGELDDTHDDFINPGLYALQLGNFLADHLCENGYPIKFRCQEDWGHWIELDHDGKFTLAIGCSNTGDSVEGQAQHRVFVSPDTPQVRRFFKKIDVEADVRALSATLVRIFDAHDDISSVRLDEAA